ncbi:AraC family transcriptional regulator [Pseudomonas sp. H9]|uniref:helix-turn-helix domain-containing protein n=1 Tax=Pseudomonas sp. H9 TaxID=483968 RepID=UPI0010583035|nr:AraC family transcriptional regulator [Pseudomonas sp. H9]TDF86256.1 AraC family transcriptional regulator [Pseudomonas sp. H9]
MQSVIRGQEAAVESDRHTASLCASIFSTWVQTLDCLGMDMARLETEWGVSLVRLRQPNLRLPAFLARRFWEVVSALSNDEAIGLEVGKQGGPAQMQGLSYLMQLLPSRLEALECMQRFWPVIAGHMALHFSASDGLLQIEILPSFGLRPAAEEADYWVAQHIQYLRSLPGAPPALCEVHLRRQRPSDPQPWLQMARMPVHFESARDLLVLDVEALRTPREAGVPAVRAALMRALQDYCERDLPTTHLEQVAASVLTGLRGELTLETVAERLHITPRTLHRSLSREGWSFSSIVETHRRYLAIDLLKDETLTIAEVADHLGYHDQSSFVRAFRRWYEMAPTEFRQHD